MSITVSSDASNPLNVDVTGLVVESAVDLNIYSTLLHYSEQEWVQLATFGSTTKAIQTSPIWS